MCKVYLFDRFTVRRLPTRALWPSRPSTSPPQHFEKLGGKLPSQKTDNHTDDAAGAPDGAPDEAKTGGLGADVSAQLAAEVKALKSGRKLLFKKVDLGTDDLLYI